MLSHEGTETIPGASAAGVEFDGILHSLFRRSIAWCQDIFLDYNPFWTISIVALHLWIAQCLFSSSSVVGLGFRVVV